MDHLIDNPLIVFAVAFFVLWLSAWIGSLLVKTRRRMEQDVRDDFSVVRAATLTLLALVIGFCFSMAVNRYDQRKNCEAAETGAIRTAYVRADLLPGDNAAKVRALLKNYLNQRISFYREGDQRQIQRINVTIAQLQSELWSTVSATAATQPTAVTALVIASVNDVLNSRGSTQAAWWNRIPIGAWGLVAAIAICCNFLVGYGERRAEAEHVLMLVLPLVVSIAFFLIADIDSPRGGVIRLQPQNLESLARSLDAG